MNSSVCGVEKTLTVVPDWLVKVRLLNWTAYPETWSFAVLDARRTTEVFPGGGGGGGGGGGPFEPQPRVKLITRVIGMRRWKVRGRRVKDNLVGSNGALLLDLDSSSTKAKQ